MTHEPSCHLSLASRSRATAWCAALAALVAMAWPSNAAARTLRCGDLTSGAIKEIRATYATCATARDVARSWLRYPKNRRYTPDSRGRRWACSPEFVAHSEGGSPEFTPVPVSRITCTRRASTVTFDHLTS